MKIMHEKQTLKALASFLLRGVENHLPNFKKGWGIDWTLILKRGMVGKRRRDLQFAHEK